MQLLLGIDGGGSRTRVAIADASGAVLGKGQAGSSNHQSVGFAAATQALHEAIRAARMDAGIDAHTPFDAACFGLAGAGRPDDQMRFTAWAAEYGIATNVRCVSDAEIILAAGTPEQWGVALISGTGSLCWATRAAAMIWQCALCGSQHRLPMAVPPHTLCLRPCSNTGGSLSRHS